VIPMILRRQNLLESRPHEPLKRVVIKAGQADSHSP
jgi:hypothetical protein